MKIAYLIIAHDNPAHLERLTNALYSENSVAYVHIDRKSALHNFTRIRAANTVLSPERIPVYWGDFSQIEATLALIRLGLADERHFDYFVLLSGADYPLRTAASIEQFFEHNSGDEYISVDRTASDSLRDRLDFYRVRPTDRLVARVAYAAAMIFRIRLRRDHRYFLGDMVACKGSQWWALSRDACAYILQFVANETQIVDFFKHTRCPDESFFQTIIGNSPFKTKIKSTLTYADWSRGGPSPQLMTKDHIANLRSAAFPLLGGRYCLGEFLFARKFTDESAELVKELEAMKCARSN